MTRAARGILVGVTVLAVPCSAASQSTDLRLAGIIMTTRQTVHDGEEVYRASAPLTGAEILLWPGGIGLYGRYLTGTLGDHSARGPDGGLHQAEGRIILGAPVFSVEGGFTRRVRGGRRLSDPGDNLIRAGVRSLLALGPSGLSVSLQAGAYGRNDSVPSTGEARKKLSVVGWEAATGLVYQAPHGLPFFVTVGYRFERIRSEADYLPVHREELSGLVFSAGLRHLGRRTHPANQAF